MSGQAQVRSSDAIEAFSLALAAFAERVENVLNALDNEVRRSDGWIEHDRPAHWKKKLHEAEDGVHQAKLDLERCLLMTTVDGQRPACREQKTAVEQAKARLDYCREKMEVVRKWRRNFRHDSLEFRGRVGQLRRVIELDVPTARAVLAKILGHLEEYQLERPPDAFNPLGETTSAAAEATTRTPAAAAPANGAEPAEAAVQVNETSSSETNP